MTKLVLTSIIATLLLPTLASAQCLTHAAGGSAGDPCAQNGCTSGALAGPTNCADVCTTCGNNEISIEIDTARCEGRNNCVVSPLTKCDGGDDVEGAATITLSGNTGCTPTTRAVVICESWLNCTDNSVLCARCTEHPLIAGSSNAYSTGILACASDPNESYSYVVTVDDVSGGSGSCTECPSATSCPAANCLVDNCDQKARAGSCCLLFGPAP